MTNTDRWSSMTQRDQLAVPAYTRLATRIREQILSGELSPGDRLPPEAELSTHYQVSRNTAREAIRALASQGLLTVRRGVTGGTFVALPSLDQVSGSLQTSIALLADSADLPVWALVEIRELLEVPGAELAALRRTDDDLAELEQALFDPVAVDPGSVYVHTRDFHAGVLRATHNPLLVALAEPVHRILRDRLLRDKAPAGFWHSVDRDHREILNYLRDRDQAGAREASRAHLRALRGTYEQIDRGRRRADG